MYTKDAPKRWLRKQQVQARYGNISAKTLERHVKARRLPPPKYLFGNKIPFWNEDGEDGLEQHDRAAALKPTTT